MPTYPTSPAIRFTHAVGNETLKGELKNLILETIHTVAPEVDFSHRVLALQLTRANTGNEAGHLNVQLSGGVMSLDGMRMKVNIKSSAVIETVIHETIHWLQFQLKIATAVKVNGRFSYLWCNSTGALLNARGQGDNALLNMMTEGRTWNTVAPVKGGAGVRETPSMGMNTRAGCLNYYLDPAEAQAHRLAFGIAKQMGMTAHSLRGCMTMALRQFEKVQQYKPRPSQINY